MLKKLLAVSMFILSVLASQAYAQIIEVNTEYFDGSYINYTVVIPDSYVYKEGANSAGTTGLSYQVVNLDAFFALSGKRFTDPASEAGFFITESSTDNNTTLNVTDPDNIVLILAETDQTNGLFNTYSFDRVEARYTYRRLSNMSLPFFGGSTPAYTNDIYPLRSYFKVNTTISSLDEAMLESESGPWFVKHVLPDHLGSSVGEITYKVEKVNGNTAIKTTLFSATLGNGWVSNIKKAGGIDSQLVIEVNQNATDCKLKLTARYEIDRAEVKIGSVSCI